MADVKMTLKEYNDLRDRMVLLEKAIDLLLTPMVDDDELKEAEANGNYFNYRSQFRLSNPVIQELIEERLELPILDDCEKVEMNEYVESLNLGTINFKNRTKCRECGKVFDRENTLYYHCNKAYCKDHCSECKDYADGNCYYLKQYGGE